MIFRAGLHEFSGTPVVTTFHQTRSLGGFQSDVRRLLRSCQTHVENDSDPSVGNVLVRALPIYGGYGISSRCLFILLISSISVPVVASLGEHTMDPGKPRSCNTYCLCCSAAMNVVHSCGNRDRLLCWVFAGVVVSPYIFARMLL